MTRVYELLPLFVLVLVLIVGAIRHPFKDNQPWRRMGSVVLGLAFVVWGAVAVGAGHITAWRRNTHTYSVATDPIGFWLVVVFVLTLGMVCVYRGIRGKR